MSTAEGRGAVIQDTRDLPTFIVIGAMKAGTTSLYHYLANHPQIFMSKIKELDFFVAESNWSRGLEWYRHQFSGAHDSLACGEASTFYTQYPEYDGVPERMARLLPDVRLVYVVRHPIVRMRSHYQHQVLIGAEKAPPEVALLENPTYLACSSYAMQLDQYLAHFPREQILIVPSESLRTDRLATVQSVYDFLGVDKGCVPEELDTEFYRTAQRQSYPRLVLWGRRIAKRHAMPLQRVKGIAESVWTHKAGAGVGPRAGSRQVDESGDRLLSPVLQERLADLLRDDVARFRTYMPPDFDGWGLA